MPTRKKTTRKRKKPLNLNGQVIALGGNFYKLEAVKKEHLGKSLAEATGNEIFKKYGGGWGDGGEEGPGELWDDHGDKIEGIWNDMVPWDKL